MPVCTKCSLDKPQEQYYVEERWGKLYYKKYCLDCFRAQSREWKRRKKLEKQQMINIPQPKEIIEPEVPESQPDILEDGMVCRDCYVWKPLTEFHQNRQHNRIYYYKNCKPCYSDKMNKSKNFKDPFGSIYRPKPNEYMTDYQREKVFEVMIALGWIFDEITGIWNKPGLKEKGKFLKVIPDVKKPRRKTSHGNVPVVYNYLMENIEDIIKYRKEGVPFTELEDIYECSHTTIRKAVHDYQYEKAKKAS